MALRKPIVLRDGILEQLQSGDILDAPVNSNIELTMTNNIGSTLNICQILYIDAPNSVQLARANAISTANVFGLCAQNSITNGAPAVVHLEGVLEALDTEWYAIVEGGSNIAAGVVYYLSPTTAGKMTSTPPTTAGQFLVRMGVAISATLFKVDIEAPIKL